VIGGIMIAAVSGGDMKKQCFNCGKEIPSYKYFCDIECEVAHADQLNQQNDEKQ
jgi:predicted nucleic acid-binding Zn ribbon protein